MKPGRNEPCPCGSGKKYKHCCLAAEMKTAEAPDEIAWRRLRRALEGFPASMLNFVVQVYGQSAIAEAWDEFTLWEDVPFEDHTPHAAVFFPWMYHVWSPDPEDTSVRDPSLHGVPPAQAYLQLKGRHLEPAARRYREACLAAPLSFHEILRCEPGRGFGARDLITGVECEVREQSASRSMQVGDILFGSLVPCDGIVLLESCAPCSIPPIHKIEIVKLRKRIAVGGDLFPVEMVREWDDELRALYLDLMEPLLYPSLPELRNTDGEALSMQRLIYDIDSPEAAFDALKHLAWGEAEADLRADADLDSEGRLSRISFDWRKPGNRVHQSWNNTILGNLEITAGRLTAQVNSQERADQLKQIIEERLGGRVRYRATEIQSMERALVEGQSDLQAADRLEQVELMQDPEVQAQLREMLSRHYDDWLHQSIPALDGRTPLQAIEDPDGREMVEALIMQIERNGDRPGAVDQAFFAARLRERLGFTPSSR